MVLKADQLRVKTLLAETITLLCKNGLHFKTKFSIEGLIGITLDEEDIFLVNINETIKTAESVQENVDDNDALEQPAPPCAKRVRNKVEGVANQVSPRLTESPASPTAKSLDTCSRVPKISSVCRSRSLRSNCQTSAISIAVKPTELRAPRTADASPGIGAFSGPNDYTARFGNDSLPESSVGLSECESQAFSSVAFKTDAAEGPEAYDDNKTILTEADLPERPNKRVRLGSSDVLTESLMVASTSSETNAAFTVPKERTEFEAPDVIEIKEESLSDDETQKPGYSEYEGFNNTVPHDSFGTNMRQGFGDSSMFQAGSSFFVSQQDEVNHTPDWFDPGLSRRDAPKSTKDRGTYECKICGQKFTWMAALLQHENCKHGRRPHPFLCQICSKGFWNQRGLRGHLASKHRMQKDYRCPICGREYSYKTYLKVHMRTCHGIDCS